MISTLQSDCYKSLVIAVENPKYLLGTLETTFHGQTSFLFGRGITELAINALFS